MHRIGHLMEQMLTEENFIDAEKALGKNKPDNRQAQHIARNARKYGLRLLEKVKHGYTWHEPRKTTIKDSYKGKERGLKIPCLEDQAAQIAWLNIATPHIERRNYYYNCGSIPSAGQTRCVKALRKWVKNPKVKYGAVTDIRKFYDTCPHWLIRQGLERIFKDKAFVDFAMSFIASMSDNDIGLAIGYPSSHWLANVALMELDHQMRQMYPDVHYTRYMDDVGMASANKRHMRMAVRHIMQWVIEHGMKLKKWSRFRIMGRGLQFLSYRFFSGYTLLTKPLMVRISRRMKKAKVHMSVHAAAAVVSYFGILKWCNSYHYRQAHVYPYVDKHVCIRLIADASRKMAGVAT